jgi:hypothetical protein
MALELAHEGNQSLWSRLPEGGDASYRQTTAMKYIQRTHGMTCALQYSLIDGYILF